MCNGDTVFSMDVRLVDNNIEIRESAFRKPVERHNFCNISDYPDYNALIILQKDQFFNERVL